MENNKYKTACKVVYILGNIMQGLLVLLMFALLFGFICLTGTLLYYGEYWKITVISTGSLIWNLFFDGVAVWTVILVLFNIGSIFRYIGNKFSNMYKAGEEYYSSKH